MSRKNLIIFLLILVFIPFIVLLFPFINIFPRYIKAPSERPLDFCDTADDCEVIFCAGCTIRCIKHACTLIRCEDHGKWDMEQGKCICHEGYDGPYCEDKI